MLIGKILNIWEDSSLRRPEQLAQVTAAMADASAVVELLLSAGASPNNVSWRKQRIFPLILAAQGSPYGPFCDILRKLLAAGADTRQKDAAGRTA